jgi:hypothetical protein
MMMNVHLVAYHVVMRSCKSGRSSEERGACNESGKNGLFHMFEMCEMEGAVILAARVYGLFAGTRFRCKARLHVARRPHTGPQSAQRAGPGLKVTNYSVNIADVIAEE